MRDQVKKLHDLGVSAVSLLRWIESDEEAKALEEGNYSVLYGTPELLLKTKCIAEKNGLCWLLMHEAHVSIYYNKS
jgi:superfamily II DNA helicase RecQ